MAHEAITVIARRRTLILGPAYEGSGFAASHEKNVAKGGE
jgi:hypothetical protein